MKYSINNLPKSVKFLFFWGHRSSKDGSISKSCLSQWWLSEFKVNGVCYKTAEHWMMAKKAALFDPSMIEQIVNTSSAAEAKKLGRMVKNFDDKTWLENRYDIVREGNFHKFSQHKDLKEFLISTNNRILVEASPVDRIWGVGLQQDNPKILNPKNWKGLNLLGFALMEVRDELITNP